MGQKRKNRKGKYKKEEAEGEKDGGRGKVEAGEARILTNPPTPAPNRHSHHQIRKPI